MLNPVLVTPASATPVSVDELKLHLRLDSDDEDALVGALLSAAVQHVDGYAGVLGRTLMPQTWRQDFSGFDNLCLALAPVTTVAVTYFDTANNSQSLSASVYSLLDGSLGPYLSLNSGQVWPGTSDRPDAVRVTMTCGYADAGAVPAPIKVAIMLLAAHWFQNREAVNIGDINSALPLAVDALLSPFRRVGI